MADKYEIKEGMIVRSSDGEKLGKVVRFEDEAFVVEKGLFFRTDYIIRYDEVSEIRNGEVVLTHGRDRLAKSTDETRTAHEALRTEQGEEIRIPLVEEELGITKSVEQVGEVRVHKEVVTEERQVTVPVSHEVVRVERVPAAAGAMTSSETMFTEESVSMPVREERIEIEKHPVVKEEISIRKETVHEQQTAAATLRREEAEVRAEGDVVTESTEAEPAPISRVQGTGVDTSETPPQRATGTGGRRG